MEQRKYYTLKKLKHVHETGASALYARRAEPIFVGGFPG
jgi:hypothetical protein